MRRGGLIIWALLGALLAGAVLGTAEDPDVAQSAISENGDDVASTVSEASLPEKKTLVLEGLDEDQTSQLLAESESRTFRTEVNRMMKLIINSLYKNRDIFLRELISNASDALDKIRFLSLTNKEVLAANPELAIKIRADQEHGVLHIEDSGVGMTREELEKNLGTIARSGTADFMEALQQGDDKSLIGQFGVGFYSSFLVADTVVVTSKSNDDDQYLWESDATSFKIMKDPRGEEYRLPRGTRISLYMKDEVKDFLKTDTLRDLVAKYSQFINFPIYLYTSKEVEKEVVPEKAEDEEDETLETEEEEKQKVEKVKETVWDYEQLNTVRPLWTRNSKDITEEEYEEFYKSAFHQVETPVAHIHFDAEGEVSFKALLYTPVRAAQNLLTEYNRAQAQIKLFVRRVLISDDVPDILPRYLSFLVGLVDSDDLPLNVSRETLQQSKLIKLIRKKLVRKALEMFKKLAEKGEEAYLAFWKEFGVFLKMGTIEDSANRGKLAKLLRFPSSQSSNLTSLDAYVERMKNGQEAIYYLPAISLEEAKLSPLSEALQKKGYEIFYFVEPIDEYLANHLQEFDGKKLVNVAKKDLKLKESDKEKLYLEREKKRYAMLTAWLPKVLGKKIDSAVISNRLDTSPFALVAHDWSISGTMARHMRAQGDRTQRHLADIPPVLEVNPRHPLVKQLQTMLAALPESLRETDEAVLDMARTMHDAAVLRSGYELGNLSNFAERLEKMLRRASGVAVDEPVLPEPDYDALSDVDDDEDEDETVPEKEEEEIALDEAISISDMEGEQASKLSNSNHEGEAAKQSHVEL